jgi:hypothetical protein
MNQFLNEIVSSDVDICKISFIIRNAAGPQSSAKFVHDVVGQLNAQAE